MFIFRTINYDEGNEESLGYKSVEIHFGERKYFFDSGDFVIDWYNSNKFIFKTRFDDPELKYFEIFGITNSSSVDHFIMDGAPYDAGYLMIDDDKVPYLSYIPDHYDEGITNFVPEGSLWSWSELQEYVKVNE